MSKTSANLNKSHLLDKSDNDVFQTRGSFLTKPRANTMNASSLSSLTDRTPSNLLELKRQRLEAAADRKKRWITRVITIVGLLIIVLCAAIVTLTLKMAPKIDELVRSKAGVNPSVNLMSRMTTSLMTPTITSNNLTANTSHIIKSTFRLRRRVFI